jgi:transcriptional regulator with XRE-family HTH domain
MLTPNQIKAAELLSQGCSHQEVADACNVSRRTILRWLNQNDFKNLSFGLIHRQRVAQQAPQRPPERHRQSSNLTPQDLVEDALVAVRGILNDPDSRNCDRLKAAALVGEWSGLNHRGKIVEAQALKVLIDAGWIPEEPREILLEGWAELEARMKAAFINGQKKDPLQESEEGTFDVDVDEFDDLDEFDDE